MCRRGYDYVTIATDIETKWRALEKRPLPLLLEDAGI